MTKNSCIARCIISVLAAVFIQNAIISEPLSTSELQNESALCASSFGVFTCRYDHVVDGLYWNDYENPKASAYSGITNNYLNINGAAVINDIYLAGRFYEKTANYRDWPDNMTNLFVDAFMGMKNGMSFRASYFDFCFSDDKNTGKGKIKPGIAVAKTIETSQSKLRLSAKADYQQLYWKSNLVDLRQVCGTFAASYGSDADNIIAISYTIMTTFEGTNNRTDTNDIPLYHKLSGCFGHTWHISDNACAGIHPSVFAALNAINPTGGASLLNPQGATYNEVPEKNETEVLFRLPLSVAIQPFNDKIEFIASVMFGLYYATFDHLDSACLGGFNKSGWVPETGIAFGLVCAVNPKCTVQAGVQFIRVPEISESEYKYKENGTNGITTASLGESPLSVSIMLHL